MHTPSRKQSEPSLNRILLFTPRHPVLPVLLTGVLTVCQRGLMSSRIAHCQGVPLRLMYIVVREWNHLQMHLP